MSAVTNMIMDAASSALGVIGKAQLIFHVSDTAATTQAGNQAVINATKQALTDAGKAAKASRIMNATGVSQSGLHTMEVQYNPSSLSIQANAEPIPFQMLQDNVNSNIPNQLQRDPAVVLSVELIFDDMNPTDAFMAEKFMFLNGLSVGNLLSLGGTAVRAAQGKVYSVQQQTNALVAAVIRDRTRSVTFKWANMSFTGELTEADASYTMFSVSGRPVRSTVRLNITQQMESETNGGYWDGAFDRAFTGNAIPGQSKGKSASSQFGNLINFNF